MRLSWMAGLAIMVAAPVCAQCPDGTPPPCARVSLRGLAVLPLESLSPDTADNYVADGLTDELIQRLQGVGLAVLSHAAVRRFRGTTIAPDQLGRSLNVGYFLTGSVRRARGVLRVTVELLRASSGERVWGETFDRTSDDALAVETEIALRVAEAIAGRLQPAQRQAIMRRATTNGPAYDAYLRGNVELARRSGSAALRAIAAYEEAIRLDPGLAKAWGRLGFVYGLAAMWRWPELRFSRDSMLSLGRAATDRGLLLDSSEAEVWMARGYVNLLSGRADATSAALDVLRRADALDPNNSEIHHQLGWVLLNMGRFAEAAAAFNRTLAIEPGRRVTLSARGQLELLQRHWRAAESWLDSALAIEPWPLAYSWRARSRLALGDTAGARRDAQAAMVLKGSSYVSSADEATLAVLDVQGGDTAAARRRLARLERPSAPFAGDAFSVPGVDLATARLVCGDRSGALDALEQTSPRDFHLYWAVTAREQLDPLRDEPRLERVLQEARPR